MSWEASRTAVVYFSGEASQMVREYVSWRVNRTVSGFLIKTVIGMARVVEMAVRMV